MREEQLPFQHPKCPVEKRLSPISCVTFPSLHGVEPALLEKREAPHFREGGGDGAAAATLAAQLESTTPMLAPCDGNTTYSLGLMGPKKGHVPYAVRVVCAFLQEFGCTRMVRMIML